MDSSEVIFLKKWETVAKLKINPPAGGEKLKIDDIIYVLLENRGIKTKKEIQEFLNPKLESVTAKNVGIDQKQLKIATDRIKKAIQNKEQIIVFGDYDVDGICGTAIFWESLNSLGANVLPYIPHRIDEGYGLSIKGIESILTKRYTLDAKPSLIITVDNGIVANTAVEFANKQGIDVIITDHHLPSKKLPKALAIVHTTKICGAGVAWLLARSVWQIARGDKATSNELLATSHLELVALATIADLVPLLGFNRTLVKFGLEELRKTKRIGLLELFKEAVLDQLVIGVYEVGHIIAPRLNAMGRMEYAMDSLRLLCTPNKEKARILAETLGRTNKERQELTIETTAHASAQIRSRLNRDEIRKLLFIAHESYQQGVIGLVAGKLVEEFYRPTIIISKGEKYSKASARSVHGFNIIEFIREAEEFLVDVGGHPMAAGFTVETEKLELLQKTLEDLAEKLLDDGKLIRTLRIDYELPLGFVSNGLYDEIQKLAPFGMGNPEPTFVSKEVIVEDLRVVGKDGKHLKFKFQISNFKFQIEAIAFGMGERSGEFHIGDTVDIAYTINEDRWDGNKRLQLKIKDLKK